MLSSSELYPFCRAGAERMETKPGPGHNVTIIANANVKTYVNPEMNANVKVTTPNINVKVIVTYTL